MFQPRRELLIKLSSQSTLQNAPEKIDSLITRLAPDSFAEKLRNASPEVRAAANALQSELVTSLKTRFADLFLGGSLALAAASVMPGPGRTNFVNFTVTPQILAEVDENILDDGMALLSSDYPADELEEARAHIRLALSLCRKRLAKLPRETK